MSFDEALGIDPLDLADSIARRQMPGTESGPVDRYAMLDRLMRKVGGASAPQYPRARQGGTGLAVPEVPPVPPGGPDSTEAEVGPEAEPQPSLRFGAKDKVIEPKPLSFGRNDKVVGQAPGPETGIGPGFATGGTSLPTIGPTKAPPIPPPTTGGIGSDYVASGGKGLAPAPDLSHEIELPQTPIPTPTAGPVASPEAPVVAGAGAAASGPPPAPASMADIALRGLEAGFPPAAGMRAGLDLVRGSELEKGFKGGLIGTNPKMFGDAAEGLGVLAGSETLQEAGKKIAGYGKEQLESYKARVPSFTDIRTDSVGNFLADVGSYAGYQAGAGTATSVPSLVTGGLAGLATANPLVGIAVGALGPSYIQNFGDVYGSAKEDKDIAARIEKGELTPKELAGTAALAAIPMAALDVVGLETVLGATVFAEAKRDLAKRIIRGIGIGAITEGSTEGLQEVISQWAQHYLGSQTEMKDKVVAVIDNVLGGILSGGPMGGVGAAAGRGRSAPAGEPAADERSTPGEIDEFLARDRGMRTREEIEEFMRAKAARDAAQEESEAHAVLPTPAVAGGARGAEPATPGPEGPSGAAPEQTERAETPAPAVDQDTILSRYGHSDADIAAMSPRQKAAEVEEAVRAGVPSGPLEGTRAAPVEVKTAEDLRRAEAVVEPDPTAAQAKAENYQHGHIEIPELGLTGARGISIETPAGGTRKGPPGPDGAPEWAVKVAAAYGRIKGTKGADGQPLDIFVGPLAGKASHVYVIDQVDPKTGAFDEHKSLAGFPSAIAAQRAYVASYDDQGRKRIGGITPLSRQAFQDWIASGDTVSPLSEKLRTAAPQDHHAEVGAALKSVGEDPRGVDKADIARAAEIAKNEGVPPDVAFTMSVIRGLVDDGHMTAQQFIEAAGNEAAEKLLYPGTGTGNSLRTSAGSPAVSGKAAAAAGAKRAGSSEVGSEARISEAVEGTKAQISEAAEAAGAAAGRPAEAAAELASGSTEQSPAVTGERKPGAGGEGTAPVGKHGAAGATEDLSRKPGFTPSQMNRLLDDEQEQLIGMWHTAKEPLPPNASDHYKQTMRGYRRTLNDAGIWQARSEDEARDILFEKRGERVKATKPETIEADKPEHPGLVIKSLETGKVTHLQPAGTKAPKPITPQIPNEPGTKYVLPSFATGQHAAPKAEKSESQKPSVEKTETIQPKAPETGPSDSKDYNTVALAREFAKDLAAGKPITIPYMQHKATQAFGGKLSEGKFDRKDMYDALELGVNMMIKETRHLRVDSPNPQHAVKMLEDVLAKLPTQTVRSEEQIQFQQFSTPPTYAAAVAYAAALRKGDVALEPSAGTGSIVAASSASGVKIIANELSDRRAAMLRALVGDDGRVFTENADQLNNVLPKDVQPTVVVMNPPFSQTAGRMGDKRDINVGANHIEQALKRLAPGGRLVAIVGRGMTMGAPRFRDWWAKVGEANTVRANIGVDGKVYGKYGTNFGTRLLVIDKVAPSGEKPILSEVQTVEDLMRALEPIRNGRPAAELKPTEQSRAPVAEGGAQGRPEPGLPARSEPSGVGAGERGAGGLAEPEPARPGAAGGQPVRVEAGERHGVAPVEPGRPGSQRAAIEPRPRDTGGGQPAVGSVEHPQRDLQPTGVGEPRPAAGSERIAVEQAAPGTQAASAITESLYENYEPQRVRIKGAKKHPGPLVESAAMSSVSPPAPTYRPSLPKNVIDDGLLSLPQLEAVVYAGQAHQRMLPAAEGQVPVRAGYFVGDGTGVGKGREIAGIILDNWQQGRTKAVWVSEKKKLLNDAKRDWGGLGQNANHLFDASKVKSGEPIQAGKGVAFITYDTLKSGMSDQAALARGQFIRNQAVTVNGQPGKITKVAQVRKGEPPKLAVRLDNGTEVEALADEVSPIEAGATIKTRVDQLVDWFGKDYDGVIAFDECVPAGTLISTPSGAVPIEQLKIGDTVLGLDHGSNHVVPTTIQWTFRRRTRARLHQIGPVTMTGNHPVWTKDHGYVDAAKVAPTDTVMYISQHGQRTTLRALSEGLPSEAAGAAVLQQDMQRERVGEARNACTAMGENVAGETCRAISSAQGAATENSGHRKVSARAQAVSKIIAQSIPKSQGHQKSDDGLLALAGRERKSAATGAPTIARSAWVGSGVSGWGNPVEAGLAEVLPDRHCGTEAIDCRGSGWLQPSECAAENPRQAQNRISASPRMDSSEILELGRSEEHGRRCDDDIEGIEVFNIETGTANYFANSLLVHNCHNMGNASAVKGDRGQKEAAQKALAGLLLQERLPNARVVYVSATGATEVSNLAYADRLGLWGRGTPFASRNTFVSEVEQGGIAAMELIARDMKQLGLYIARNLSYDGVEYSRLEHKLDPNQREIYDTVAEAWQGVLRNINQALKDTGGNKNRNAKSAAMSAFWGAHQRFFNQVITSLQMPSVIKAVAADLAAGRQAVLQLTNTNEASQERAAAKAETAEDIEDLDITPRDQIIQLVEKSFPTQQYEKFVDENGKEGSRPAMDSAGNPIQNADAVRMRETLIDRLASIKVPQGPLDMVLDHFGIDTVAEVTGRKRRFVMKPEEKTGAMRRVEDSRPGSANQSEIDAFQAGKKKVLVFSEAGGTGASYHADNQSASKGSRRAHYLVQAGWRADKAVQGFGRTHRTNQASAPIFHLVTTDLDGQKRFISSIARRLGQLGALTKGERKAGDQGVFSARDNLESTEAATALQQFYHGLAAGSIEGVGIDEFERQTGLALRNRDSDGAVLGMKQDLPPITTFLNRLLSLKIDLQNRVFAAFSERLDAVIEARQQAGLLDVGLETVRADKITKDSEKTVHTAPDSGAETKYVRLTVANRFVPTAFKAIGNNRARSVSQWVKSPNGKVYAVTEAPSKTQADTGAIIEQYRLIGPSSSRLIEQHHLQDRNARGEFGTSWTRIEKPAAEVLWQDEIDKAPEFVTRDLHLITGAILPIWDRLKGNPRVVRLQTDEGERLMGRVVPEKMIGATLKALGAETQGAKLDSGTLFAKLMGGDQASLANGWVLKRSLVAGERRIELRGPSSPSEGAQVKADGVFTERISYETRYFVPTDETEGPKVLAALTEHRPVIETGGAAGAVSDSGDSVLGSAAPPVADNLTPAARQRLADLAEMVDREITRLVGPDVARRFHAGTMIDPGQNIEGWGDLAKSGFVGTYDITRQLIAVALGASNPVSTGRHEAIHHIERALTSDSEKAFLTHETTKRLRNTVRDLYGWSPEEAAGVADEEVRARAAEAYFADRDRGGNGAGFGFHVGIRRIFERIYQLIRAVKNWLTGHGFQTIEDFFERAHQGEFAKRGGAKTEAASSTASDTMASVAPSPGHDPAPPEPGAIGRALRTAAERAMEVVGEAQMAVAPMAAGSNEAIAAAKDYANAIRQARNTWSRRDDLLKQNFTSEQRAAMWVAADQENVARQDGVDLADTEGRGALSDRERMAVDSMVHEANATFRAAQEVGIAPNAEGMPYYVPRMMVMLNEAGHFEKPPSGEGYPGNNEGIGREFKTSTPQMKRRKYKTAAETEAAMKARFGESAQIAKDIRSLSLATAKLQEAIAARTLVNHIKSLGSLAGRATVSEGVEPRDGQRWFTLDHPAFKTFRPVLRKDTETGRWRHVEDENGNPMFERVPIYIRSDFKGPLMAVMGRDTGKIYQGFMALKGKSMSVIMYSPVIHNMVEWSRALPAAPLKVATLYIYFEGNRAKNDPAQMRQAIGAGLVPIGKRFFNQDITSLMEEPNIAPGRSWTASVVAFAPCLFNERAGNAAKASVDKAGDFWHNTLLWDRIADLQMGLYVNMRRDLIRKGHDAETAARTAAHFANRYAGALPLEAMSVGARKFANVMLFSRTFTLGNLGAMKDAVRGLPKDVQAQILRDAGPEALGKIKGYARRKSIAILMLDIALGLVVTSLLQDALKKIRGDKDWLGENGLFGDYYRRFIDLLHETNKDPASVILHPINSLWKLSSTLSNEPRKREGMEARVLLYHDRAGRAIYGRNPLGKIGEEFTGWPTAPTDMLMRKLSPVARGTLQSALNDKYAGSGFDKPTRIWRPNPEGWEWFKNAGRIAAHMVEAHLPSDQLRSAYDLAIEGKKDPNTDILKMTAPFAGVSISQGHPGGMGAAMRAQQRENRSLDKAFGH